jgi:hypothetical protein
VRWEIEDSTGKQWAKNKHQEAGPEESPVCLPDGVYTVKGMDTYGDTWNGYKMNIVEQENMGSLVSDWDPKGNKNEYYTKTFEIKKTTPPGQRPPRTGSFTEGTGPFLAATMKFRESLSGNISSLECSTNEVYDSNKIGVNASFVHLAVRGVDERTFEFLVDGVVVCRKTMCPTCSPLIYADTWTQAVKGAALPGESASNGFGTTEAWAPKKGSTWEDTALGQVFALRFYPDTSLSDAMVSEMAQYNAKEHQLEHVCSGESCRVFLPNDGEWSAVANNNLMKRHSMQDYLEKIGGSGRSTEFVFWNWGWLKPTILVDHDNGIFVDGGTFGMYDIVFYKAAEDDEFTIVGETVDGTYLATCSSSWSGICTIPSGKRETKKGGSLYLDDDGNVFFIGVNVRRWLPKVRKWSMSLVAVNGHPGRVAVPSQSSVFFVGRKVEKSWRYSNGLFGNTGGLRDGYASIVNIGTTGSGLSSSVVLGRPTDLRCKIPTHGFSPDGQTLYVVMRAGRRETDRGDYCDPTYPHVEGIYRIVTDPCKSGVATDARIDYATYVGNIDSYSTVMTSSAVLKSGNGYVFGGALASVNVAVGAGGGDGGYNGVKAKALKYTVSMDTPEYGASTKTAELRAQYVGESTLGDVAKFTSGFNDGRDIGNTILSMDSFNTSSGVDAIVAWTVVKGLRAVNAETGELLWDAGLAESELSDCEQEAGKRELWKGYRKTSPNGDFCGTLGEAGAMFMDELGEEARERAMKDDVYHPNYGQDHCRVKVAPASKITNTESVIVALKRQTVYLLNTSGSVLSKVDISAAGNGPGYVCDKPRGENEANCEKGEGGNGFANDIPVVTDAAFSANDRMLFVSGYKFVQEFDQKENCVKKKSCRFTSVAFIRAFDLSNISSPMYAWSTWDFHRHGIFPRDFADTAALRVTVGDNGLLYAMGEARGAAQSIFRFDGKSSQSLQDLFPDCSYREINATNSLTESEWVAQRRSIASSTTYWGKGERCGRYAIPTFSEGNGEPSAWPNAIHQTKRKVDHIKCQLPNFCNHQGYVARIDIDTGEVLRGRFLVPRATKTGRTSAGLAASTALRLTDMKVDTDGRVYLTGRCRHAYPNMEQLSINGDPVQNGEGASLGSPTVTVLGNRLDTTVLWAAPRKPGLRDYQQSSLGSGVGTSITLSKERNGEIVTTVTSEHGELFTGATKAGSFVEASMGSNRYTSIHNAKADSASKYLDAYWYLLKKPPITKSYFVCNPLDKPAQPPPVIDLARWDETESFIIIRFDVPTDRMAAYYEKKGIPRPGVFYCSELFNTITARRFGVLATCTWIYADQVRVQIPFDGTPTIKTGDMVQLRKGRLFGLFFLSASSESAYVLEAGVKKLLPVARVKNCDCMTWCAKNFKFGAQHSSGGTKLRPLYYHWRWTFLQPDAEGRVSANRFTLNETQQLTYGNMISRLNNGKHGYGSRMDSSFVSGKIFWPRGVFVNVTVRVSNKPGYVHDGPASSDFHTNLAFMIVKHPAIPPDSSGPLEKKASMLGVPHPESAAPFKQPIMLITPSVACKQAAGVKPIPPGACVACDQNMGMQVHWHVQIIDLKVGNHGPSKMLIEAKKRIGIIANTTKAPAIFFPKNTLFAGFVYKISACIVFDGDWSIAKCSSRDVSPFWREIQVILDGAPTITAEITGKTTYLDSTRSFDPDWRSDGRPMLFNWKCENVLQDSECFFKGYIAVESDGTERDRFPSIGRISMDDETDGEGNALLAPYSTYHFTSYVAKTSSKSLFTSPDRQGEAKTLLYSGTVTTPKAAIIWPTNKVIVVSSKTRIRGTGLAPNNGQLEFSWNVRESVEEGGSGTLVAEVPWTTKAYMTINSNFLKEGAKYEFALFVRDEDGAHGSSKMTISTDVAPTLDASDPVSCTPPNGGSEFVSEHDIDCGQWIDAPNHMPFTYQLLYTTPSNSVARVLTARRVSDNFFPNVRLPSGNPVSVICRVWDRLGAFRDASVSVNVAEASGTEASISAIKAVFQDGGHLRQLEIFGAALQRLKELEMQRAVDARRRRRLGDSSHRQVGNDTAAINRAFITAFNASSAADPMALSASIEYAETVYGTYSLTKESAGGTAVSDAQLQTATAALASSVAHVSVSPVVKSNMGVVWKRVEKQVRNAAKTLSYAPATRHLLDTLYASYLHGAATLDREIELEAGVCSSIDSGVWVEDDNASSVSRTLNLGCGIGALSVQTYYGNISEISFPTPGNSFLGLQSLSLSPNSDFYTGCETLTVGRSLLHRPNWVYVRIVLGEKTSNQTNDLGAEDECITVSMRASFNTPGGVCAAALLSTNTDVLGSLSFDSSQCSTTAVGDSSRLCSCRLCASDRVDPSDDGTEMSALIGITGADVTMATISASASAPGCYEGFESSLGTNFICDENEPALTGTNMVQLAQDACDGTKNGELCTHVCKPGFAGGSIKCNGNGQYVVSPCAASAVCDNVEPVVANKHMVGVAIDGCDGTLADEQCSNYACEQGFAGGEITCNGNSNAYDVVACTATPMCDAEEPLYEGKNFDLAWTSTINNCDGTLAGEPCVHRCENGFTGGSITCNAMTGQYNVVACSATAACDAVDPVLANTFIKNLNPDACDGTLVGDSCNHECVQGYEGGSIVCASSGVFDVAPCIGKISHCASTINNPSWKFNVETTYHAIIDPSCSTMTPSTKCNFLGCSPGWEEDPSKGQGIKCSRSGAVTFDGCTVRSANVCDAEEPNIVGKHMYSVSPNSCDGASTDDACDKVVCHPGYTGGSITCRGDGNWNVAPCAATSVCDNMEPNLYQKNMVPMPMNSCDGTLSDELCSHACLPGFAGGSVTCWGSTAAYDVVACTGTPVCDGNEPDTTGKNMNSVTADACNGTLAGEACGEYTCETGYSGGSITCDGVTGQYDVVACTETVGPCDANEPNLFNAHMLAQPANICDGTQNGTNCTISNSLCRAGYDGGSILCDGTSGKFIVDACKPKPMCDDNEPNLMNTNMASISPNACDGTKAGSVCGHNCSTNFAGGSITCNGDTGLYDVVKCVPTPVCDNAEPLVLPSSNMSTVFANGCDGTFPGQTCNHTCLAGYSGGSITCNGTTGNYIVVPCEPYAACDENDPAVDSGAMRMSTPSTDACDGTKTNERCPQVQCNPGYDHGAITCQGNGNFLVDHCVPTAACDTAEPDTTGTHIIVNANGCDGTLVGSYCHNFDTELDYKGGSIVCNADGNYAVTSAVPICDGLPIDAKGSYIKTISQDSCDGTKVGKSCNHTCDDGFFGGSVRCRRGSGGGFFEVTPCSSICDKSNPDVTGKNMEPIEAYVCQGTLPGASCRRGAKCLPGFKGGDIVCNSLTGGFDINACVSVCDGMDPELLNKHMEDIAEGACDGTAPGALCSHKCVAGYTSGSIRCNKATGKFDVQGCTIVEEVSKVVSQTLEVSGITAKNIRDNIHQFEMKIADALGLLASQIKIVQISSDLQRGVKGDPAFGESSTVRRRLLEYAVKMKYEVLTDGTEEIKEVKGKMVSESFSNTIVAHFAEVAGVPKNDVAVAAKEPVVTHPKKSPVVEQTAKKWPAPPPASAALVLLIIFVSLCAVCQGYMTQWNKQLETSRKERLKQKAQKALELADIAVAMEGTKVVEAVEENNTEETASIASGGEFWKMYVKKQAEEMGAKQTVGSTLTTI